MCFLGFFLPMLNSDNRNTSLNQVVVGYDMGYPYKGSFPYAYERHPWTLFKGTKVLESLSKQISIRFTGCFLMLSKDDACS